MSHDHDLLDRLNGLIAAAKGAGAAAADAVAIAGTALSLARRLGRRERLERAESVDLGLRVLVGRRQAIASSSDLSPEALAELVERALAMARSVPEDPYCGLADPDQLAREVPALDLAAPAEPSAETVAEWVARAEDAALAVPGVTNSEGAEASVGRVTVALAASNGFAHAYTASHCSLSVAVLAGAGTAMERDYDYTAAVWPEDLRPPEEIGRSAGARAVGRLNPRKIKTARVPVVYDPRAARSLLGHLATAINGTAVARGTSFLKDKLGQRIFPESITVVDDPLRRRGLRSKPFDGEGIATRRRPLVEGGRLATWLLDLRSARRLGLSTTGHAARGTSGVPAPAATNLYLEAGAHKPAALIADVKRGLYITELIGFGINGVTGDYSRGATGFWIEDGERAFPVTEVTVAGNLNSMFANLTAADDLEFRYGTDAPTVRVDGMTVAGH